MGLNAPKKTHLSYAAFLRVSASTHEQGKRRWFDPLTDRRQTLNQYNKVKIYLDALKKTGPPSHIAY